MSGWGFRVPGWPEIEWRLSHWSDAVHTSIAGGLDCVGAAAQMPWRRIRCLRMAMWEGQSIARGNLLHRFADLDIQQILPGLLDVAKDMVMVLAGAMATGGVIGGVVGGAVGAFGAGAGAIPGALAGAAGGAAIGLEAGNWILVLLGLGAIGEFVLARLPRLIDRYKRGIAIAWSGPQSPTGPYPDRHAHDREQDAIHDAAKEFAAADEALVTLLLAGMAAYLLHRGGKAVSVLSREVRSGRLGEKFGDWLTRNAEKLKAREGLGSEQRGGQSTAKTGDEAAVDKAPEQRNIRTNTHTIIDNKIESQLKARGWTKQEVQATINEGPVGTTIDSRSALKTPDGLPRNDPASVYGSKSGYIVVNNRTGEVVQISGKNDPGWIPDSRIQWK